MPAISPLSKEEWEEVKEAAIIGVGYKVLAERYDIGESSIAVRAHREKWPVPKRVEALRSKHLGGSSSESEKGMTDGNVIEGKQGSKSALLVAESLDEMTNRSGYLVAKGLSSQISTAFQSPDQFRPENLKDLQAAVNILWKVSGKDKPQTNVQVNLWDREGYAQLPHKEREVDEWGE